MTGHQQADIDTLRAQLGAWKQGIPSEAAFWNRWMAERGGKWPEDFRRRFDPDTPLDPWLATAVRALAKSEVSILDVGSGPVPIIGYKLEGVSLNIAAADPLAPIYRDLLAHHRLTPPITPTFAPAEELGSFFTANSFDVVHCRNALDHSFDPLRGINEMLKVVRIGGSILLRHHQNEAEHGNYEGFHHFNFDSRDGRFIIWNKSLTIDVANLVSTKAEVASSMPGFVEVIIHKLADDPVDPEARLSRMCQYLEAFVVSANL